MYDIIIIGAGITGSMLARSLSKYDLNIAILDRHHDIACGATMANSAIVHTGYDPEDCTLKAELNVKGALLYEQICKDLGCKYEKIGAWVVSTSVEEEEQLEVLKKRAISRNIPYELLDGEQARKIETNLSSSVTKALCFPTTAVIYPWEVAIACCQVAVKNGTTLLLDHSVNHIDKTDHGFIVHTNQENLEGKLVINTSGIGCEKIARMVSNEVKYHMIPKKGEYYVLDQGVDLVKHVIFPVPSEKGKGVLAVPTVYGNILIGPNSSANEIVDVSTTQEGLSYVKQEIAKTIDHVPFNKTIRCYAGLRPSTDVSDFVIEEYSDAKGFIDVASIASPGLASAPAIAEYVIENFIQKHMELTLNENASMLRNRPVVISELSLEEKNKIIQKNPLYGKIICRCEQISEGEIVDSIHDVCGAKSVKGVKKRVRAGMGRCQAGFCQPRVVEILSRELGIDPCDVLLDDLNSNILESENRA